MCKSMLPLAMVMAVVMGNVAGGITINLRGDDGRPISQTLLVVWRDAEMCHVLTDQDGAGRCQLPGRVDAEGEVFVFPFAWGLLENEPDESDLFRDLAPHQREIQQRYAVPRMIRVPIPQLINAGDDSPITVNLTLPRAFTLTGRLRLNDRPVSGIVSTDTLRQITVATPTRGFEAHGLRVEHEQWVYSQASNAVHRRRVDAAKAGSVVDLGVVDVPDVGGPHVIRGSLRGVDAILKDPRDLLFPGVMLIRAGDDHFYSIKARLSPPDYPLNETRGGIPAGTYYLVPGAFSHRDDQLAIIEAVMSDTDLSAFDLPTITVDEQLEPLDIDVPQLIRRYRPLAEAFRSAHPHDSGLTVKVTARDGRSSE